MAGKGRIILLLSGFAFIAAGSLAGFPGPWPWVLVVLGLGQIVAAGGFG
ncbi:MAG: hypothetical protein K6T29_01485 [Peptococcaceae bacterium]|nr:hypothetical protein [Peptococcaceae bacterium]